MNNSENLNFDNEYDSHTSFKNCEESGCGHGLNSFLIDLSDCVLCILQEVGAERKVSAKAPLTLGHHDACFCRRLFLFSAHSSQVTLQSGILLSVWHCNFQQRANPSGEFALSGMHTYVDDCHACVFKLITKFWSHGTKQYMFYRLFCVPTFDKSLSVQNAILLSIWHCFFSRGKPQRWVCTVMLLIFMCLWEGWGLIGPCCWFSWYKFPNGIICTCHVGFCFGSWKDQPKGWEIHRSTELML